MTTKCKVSYECNNIISLCDDYYSTIDAIDKFTRNTFRCDSIDYNSDVNGCLNFNDYILNRINKDSSAKSFIFGVTSFDCGSSSDGYEKKSDLLIKNQDMDFVFDNLNLNIDLYVVGELGRDYRYGKPIHHKKVSIGSSFETPFHFLHESASKHIHIETNAYRLSEFNEYLRRWIEGKQPNILCLQVAHKLFHEDLRNISLKEVTKGIKVFQYNRKRNKNIYEKTLFNDVMEYNFICSDIIANDGTEATIAGGYSTFWFVVWKPLQSSKKNE